MHWSSSTDHLRFRFHTNDKCNHGNQHHHHHRHHHHNKKMHSARWWHQSTAWWRSEAALPSCSFTPSVSLAPPPHLAAFHPPPFTPAWEVITFNSLHHYVISILISALTPPPLWHANELGKKKPHINIKKSQQSCLISCLPAPQHSLQSPPPRPPPPSLFPARCAGDHKKQQQSVEDQTLRQGGGEKDTTHTRVSNAAQAVLFAYSHEFHSQIA